LFLFLLRPFLLFFSPFFFFCFFLFPRGFFPFPETQQQQLRTKITKITAKHDGTSQPYTATHTVRRLRKKTVRSRLCTSISVCGVHAENSKTNVRQRSYKCKLDGHSEASTRCIVHPFSSVRRRRQLIFRTQSPPHHGAKSSSCTVQGYRFVAHERSYIYTYIHTYKHTDRDTYRYTFASLRADVGNCNCDLYAWNTLKTTAADFITVNSF